MRHRLLFSIALFTLAAPSCVGLLSHSYSYMTIDRHPTVSETDWTPGLLHLTEPVVDYVVIDLTHRLEDQCGGRGLVNVQTTITMRELILVQIYSVRLSAGCVPDGPHAGVQGG